MPSPTQSPDRRNTEHQPSIQNKPCVSPRDTNTGYLFCPHCGQVMAATGGELRCRRCGFQCCPTCGDA